MPIRFNIIDGFVISLDGKIRHLALFNIKSYTESIIYKKVILQIVLIIIFGKIRIDSLIFDNVIILIKSVVNKNENKYCYNIFLEKDLYKYHFQYAIFVYYKCNIMTELKFLKELVLIKQEHQKSVIFVTIGGS